MSEADDLGCGFVEDRNPQVSGGEQGEHESGELAHVAQVTMEIVKNAYICMCV